MSSEKRIKVLSLNMWGVPGVSKKIKERARHLVKTLLDSDYDIVGLQEIFTLSHASLIQEGVRAVFEHSHWFRSGVLGSPGLLVLSRHPIVDVAFQPYPLNGYPQCVYHGDWWAGKGVGMCRIAHPLTTVDFYNTHLHAGYGPGCEYGEYKLCQAYHMAQFVALSSRDHGVVAVGDFNLTEDQVATTLFREISGLSDSYRALFPDPETAPGLTNDIAECNWKPVAESAKLCSDGSAKRIDYVFYSGNTLQCEDCCVTMGQIPGQDYSYSDHMGVEAVFKVKDNPEPVPNLVTPAKNTAESVLKILDKGIKGSYRDAKQKIFIWVATSLLWCVVIVLSGLELVPAVVSGVVASLLAAFSTGLFLYLVTFSQFEIARFEEIKNEVTILCKVAK